MGILLQPGVLKQSLLQPQPNQLYPVNMNIILFTYLREMHNRADYAPP